MFVRTKIMSVPGILQPKFVFRIGVATVFWRVLKWENIRKDFTVV
jgi:hypothetical protein